MISKFISRASKQILTSGSTFPSVLSRGFSVTKFEKLKVNHYHKLNINDFSETVNAIAFAESSERIAEIIKIAHPVFTDLLLAMALRQISDYEMPINEIFEETIVPFVTEYTKLFDRNHSHAFGETVIYMGRIGCKNQAYWDIVRSKVIDYGMARYIPLHLVGDVLRSISLAGQADAKVMQALGGQVVKHKAGLPQDQVQAALEGVEMSGVSADGFRKSLGLEGRDVEQQRAIN